MQIEMGDLGTDQPATPPSGNQLQISPQEAWKKLIDGLLYTAKPTSPENRFLKKFIVPLKAGAWKDNHTLVVVVPDMSTKLLVESRFSAIANRHLIGIINDNSARVEFEVEEAR